MKKIIIVGIMVGIAVLFSACEEILDQASVTSDAGEYTSDLAIAPPAPGEHLYIRKAIEEDLKQSLEQKGYNGVTVKSVNITSAIVKIAPNSAVKNFNAIDVLNALIETDILPADTIAIYTNTLTDATTLNMNPVAVDITDYLEANEYAFVIDGLLKETLTDTLKINFEVTYNIELGLNSSSFVK